MKFLVKVDVEFDESMKNIEQIIEEALRDHGYSATAEFWSEL